MTPATKVVAALARLPLTPVLFFTGIELFTYPTNDPPLWLNILGGIGFWFWWLPPIITIALLISAVVGRR